jgi:hypothetical protein
LDHPGKTTSGPSTPVAAATSAQDDSIFVSSQDDSIFVSSQDDSILVSSQDDSILVSSSRFHRARWRR